MPRRWFAMRETGRMIEMRKKASAAATTERTEKTSMTTVGESTDAIARRMNKMPCMTRGNRRGPTAESKFKIPDW